MQGGLYIGLQMWSHVWRGSQLLFPTLSLHLPCRYVWKVPHYIYTLFITNDRHDFVFIFSLAKDIKWLRFQWKNVSSEINVIPTLSPISWQTNFLNKVHSTLYPSVDLFRNLSLQDFSSHWILKLAWFRMCFYLLISIFYC